MGVTNFSEHIIKSYWKRN